jgi:hypothetical protein
MSRTFNLWTMAQAELLQIAARTHDFLAAHGLAGNSEQHRQTPEEASHLLATAPPTHADTLEGVNMAFPPEPPVPHIPHDF